MSVAVAEEVVLKIEPPPPENASSSAVRPCLEVPARSVSEKAGAVFLRDDASDAHPRAESSHIDVEAPLTPRRGQVNILRGRSGTLDQHADVSDANVCAGISELVIAALAHCKGWCDMHSSQIQVRDHSGHGGSTTYKITADGAEPPCVALHAKTEEKATDPVSEPRQAAAATLFSSAGLAPRRLAQGGDWFIEEWGGNTLNDGPPLVDGEPAELGLLLAKVHQLPTDWYNEWRDKLKQVYPVLEQVPDGSHVWCFTAHKSFMEDLDEEIVATWVRETPTLLSPHALRIVTCHADFHGGNLVRSADGLRCIDLEETCVTRAVQDLAGASALLLKGAAQKREFFTAYLKGMGENATDEELETLLLDAHIDQLTCFFGPLRDAVKRNKEDPNSLAHYQRELAKGDNARTDQALRSKIIDEGMIRRGGYPEKLWRRIARDFGDGFFQVALEQRPPKQLWKLVPYLLVVIVMPVFVFLGCLYFILPMDNWELSQRVRNMDNYSQSKWIPGAKCFPYASQTSCGRLWIRLHVIFLILTAYLILWPFHILLTWYVCLRGLFCLVCCRQCSRV